MPVSKNKGSFSVSDIPPKNEPAIKEFVDTEIELKKTLMAYLPHVKDATPKLYLVYKSGNTTNFRVNYIKQVQYKDSFIVTSSIVESAMYSVTKNDKGLEVKKC